MNTVNWIDKLERKFRRVGIPNLMLFVVGGNLIVYIFDLLFAAKGIGSFSGFLTFVPSLIAQGQVWRVLTFIFVPPNTSIVWIVFTLYFYYIVGTSLESAWGTFRFTFYYLIGMIGTIIAGLITGIGTGIYLNLSLFFAYAVLFPNNQVLLFFLIPIKVKWLGIADGVLFLLTILFSPFYLKIAAVMAIVNFLIFFGPTFIQQLRQRLKQRKIQKEFRQKMQGTWQR